MTNGEMGILMDFGLDKRAAIATLWTNITKQGCSMTLERQNITFAVQDSLKGCKLVRRYRKKSWISAFGEFEVAIEELP